MSTITTTVNDGYYHGVTVILHEDDFLSAQTWRYEYDRRDNNIHLWKYSQIERPSRRHDYRIKNLWNSADRRASTLPAPPIAPQEVRDAALQAFRESITLEAE